MRIKSFTFLFSNIRSFDGSRHAINFSEDKNVTILLGDNNVGKTTILDSLSIVLSAFTSQFPEGNSKS